MTVFETTAPRILARLAQDFPVLDEDDLAAIVGNLAHECEGFATLQEIRPVVPGSKGGYGWAQWTGPRRKAYEAWCRRKGWNGSEFEANYSFLFRELTGPEHGALAKLQAAQRFDDKVAAFMLGYLRPGRPHLDSRLKWAERVRALAPAELPDVPVAESPPPKPKGRVPSQGWLWTLMERFR